MKFSLVLLFNCLMSVVLLVLVGDWAMAVFIQPWQMCALVVTFFAAFLGKCYVEN